MCYILQKLCKYGYKTIFSTEHVEAFLEALRDEGYSSDQEYTDNVLFLIENGLTVCLTIGNDDYRVKVDG